jgi:hypothetical protein
VTSLAGATICNAMQRLSSQQERALELMISGSRDSEVALEVGVSRTTIWRWQTEDSVFEAESNRRRHELWLASVERLRSLSQC